MQPLRSTCALVLHLHRSRRPIMAPLAESRGRFSGPLIEPEYLHLPPMFRPRPEGGNSIRSQGDHHAVCVRNRGRASMLGKWVARCCKRHPRHRDSGTWISSEFARARSLECRSTRAEVARLVSPTSEQTSPHLFLRGPNAITI